MSHLTWDNFQTSMLTPGHRAKHRLSGAPQIDIYVENRSLEIGMLLPVSPGETTPQVRAEEMRIERVLEDGISYLRLSSCTKPLYQPFYFFMLLVADLIQVDCLPAGAAILEAVKRWDRLRQGPELLSSESRLGLLGELWCLLRLISTHGPSAIDSWIGPGGEQHDFRLDQREIEVKTAANAARTHVIHGLQQLTASPGYKLYLLSLHLQPAGSGAGFSLCDLIENVRGTLSVDARRKAQFEAALEGLGFREEDWSHYSADYGHRSAPIIIPAEDCPRITKEGVSTLLGDHDPRLVEICYTVDVDGLGHSDGSSFFLDILPNR
jgi:hypothetical protein